MKYFLTLFFVGLLILSLTLALFAQAPDTLWTKTYGSADNDRGYSVQQTTDGGYYTVENKEIGDYNWIKVFVSKKEISSFLVIEGSLKEDDARLKNIDDELKRLGFQNWSSKIIDFWVKER